MDIQEKRAIIIGCGLVGALEAHFLLKLGYHVTIYEKRDDLRTSPNVEGRSINLAMSNRARKSLKFVGLEEEILKIAVPMKGRYIHKKDNRKSCDSIPYDSITHQCLYSISRNALNVHMIKALESNPNVRMYFRHKLINLDAHRGSVTLHDGNGNVEVTASADLIIAADGAFSGTRAAIQKTSLLDFAQTYITHGYVELTIAKEQGRRMVANHLHIWPRGSFMMIALPNLDHSWTVTLFMPFQIFNQLKTRQNLVEFFTETFPDFMEYTTIEQLSEDFFRKDPQSLISIKCSPYNFGKVVLIGDAAHAMVPFYGQGMNAGFEDCYILHEALSRFGVEEALGKFSEWRKDDAHAICELAMYNYLEMRDLVATRRFRLRKWFDNMVYKLLPDLWIPLYNSVSFTDMRYKKCLENRSWQDKVIRYALISFAIIIPMGILLATAASLGYHRLSR